MDVDSAIKNRRIFLWNIKKNGIGKISKVAEDFAERKIYNIPLTNQKIGIVPSKKWKKENFGKSWFPGETLISAIGQGFVLTNPLQLKYDLITSDGNIVEPKLIHDEKLITNKNLNKYKAAISIVKSSMFKLSMRIRVQL